jgi:hypothetical protein
MINITVQHTGLQEPMKLLDNLGKNAPKAIERAVLEQAQYLRLLMVKGIRRGWPYGGDKFKPLAESTRKMKKSSKPLINHGDLIRSINITPVSAGRAVFVGIHREVRAKDGRSMVNIAELHEFGGRKPYAIKVTPKLRRFWMAMFLKGIFKAPLHWTTESIQHPAMPARPFLRPTYAYWSKDASQRFAQSVARNITKGGGVVSGFALGHGSAAGGTT